MIPALDERARQDVATGLVLEALRAFYTGRIDYHDDEYRLTWVRESRRPGELPGLIVGVVEDDTHGQVASLQIQVNAEALAWVEVAP